MCGFSCALRYLEHLGTSGRMPVKFSSIRWQRTVSIAQVVQAECNFINAYALTQALRPFTNG